MDRYGGKNGYINKAIVESAVGSPSQTFAGQRLYSDIADMASVYLFQLSEGQGFVDGNKRTAVGACIVFLMMNGYEIDCQDLDFYDVTMRVANGLMDRKEAAEWIRQHVTPIQ